MKFTAYDIGCAVLAAAILCAPAVVVAAGIVMLVPHASADTAIFYTTNESDGQVSNITPNASFATIRNNPTGAYAMAGQYINAPYLRASPEPDKYNYNIRGVLIFDTSALPDTAVIDSAYIGTHRYSSGTGLGDVEINVVKFNIDGAISGDDYDNFNWDNLSTGEHLSNLALPVATQYNFQLNPLGISNISKTGNSGFGMVHAWDIMNVSPTWSSLKESYYEIRTADYMSYIPSLEITYTVPDTAPPDSITGLTNTSVSCNQLFFNWSNPADADYAGMMLYRNNTQLANLTASDTGVSWDGLPENTDITFSSKTFDTSGNVNATFVNLTVHTDSCASPTPTPTPTPVAFQSVFISDVTCGNVPFDVTFTDTSTGENITFWSWDFGDGNTSVLEDDINLYSSPGLYTVRHSIDDGLGNISWDNRTGYIRAVPDWITCTAASGAGGGGGSTGGEAVGAAFGIVGGIIGAIVILRRRGEAP